MADHSSFFQELESMEQVVKIFDALGGKNEPRVANLVTPYRRHVRTLDCLAKEAGTTTSVPVRIYIFRDLLVVAKHKEMSMGEKKKSFANPQRAQQLVSAQAGDRSSMMSSASSALPRPRSLFRRFSFRGSTAGTGGNAGAAVGTRASVASAATTTALPSSLDDLKVKISHYYPLVTCTLKPIVLSQGQMFGLQITSVSRVVVAPEPGKGGPSDTPKTHTKVEKLELWFPSDAERTSVLEELDTLAEEGRAAENSDEEEVDEKKKRAWAKNRTKSGRLNLTPAFQESLGEPPGTPPTPSGDRQQRSGTLDPNAQPLSLADLEKRYNVEFKADSEPTAEMTSFELEFGEGPMGFSLSSGKGVGVVIARVAPGSFADVGGLMVGDRLAAINAVDVDLDTTWKVAVEMIRVAGRPIVLRIVRDERRVDAIDRRGGPGTSPTAAAPASPEKPAAASSAPAKSPGSAGSGKRKWAQNRDATARAGLISLHEVELMYKATGADDLETTVPAEEPILRTTSMDSEHRETRAESSRAESLGGGGARDARAILTEFADQADFPEERQCFALLLEILETEKSYITDLRAMIKDYIVPLRRATKRRKCRDREDGSMLCEHNSLRSNCTKTSSESGPLMDVEDVRVVFMNVETLVRLNFELLQGLGAGVRQVDTELSADASAQGAASSSHIALVKCVGVFSAALITITPFFSLYALYCHQYPAATERLALIRHRDEELDEFLRKREARSTQTSLRSLLIKPVQRVCRYPLLFEELLRKVKKCLDVYPDGERKDAMRVFIRELEQTTQAVNRIALDVDKKVERQENMGALMNVFNELGGAQTGTHPRIAKDLVAPSRVFIRCLDLFFREMPFTTEPLPCRLYLFNDLIVVAAEKDPQQGGGPLGSRLSEGPGSKLSRRTRGKSLGNLLGSMLSGSSSPGSSAGGGGAGGEAKDDPSATFALWTMRATHYLELGASTSVRPMPEPDDAGWYGFQIKHVERSTVDVDAKGTLKKGGASTRIVTSICKYEVWMPSKEGLDKLFTDIEDAIESLVTQQLNAQVGAKLYGGAAKGRTRSWAQKRGTRTNTATSIALLAARRASSSASETDLPPEEPEPANTTPPTASSSSSIRRAKSGVGVRFDLEPEQAKADLAARYR